MATRNQDLRRVFQRAPVAVKIAVIVVALAIVLFVLVSRKKPGAAPLPPAPPGAITFMFWNCENLFDDRDDKRNSIDDPYDDWFAQDAAARKLKYDHLADIILKQNDGKGPDVFAGVEVESLRAAELLKDALNAKLPDGAKKYESVVMKELTANAGRYMAPCVISRVPVDEAKTHLIGGANLRILETRLTEKNATLHLVVSHWTSQRSDDGSKKGSGRDRYATTIYSHYEKLVKDDPAADYLLCGDFNTAPDSEPVTHELHMTGSRDEVMVGKSPPPLLGLLSGKPAEKFGTHYYSHPLIYDQIGVSPGMLDAKGWSCDPDSVAVPTDGLIRDKGRVRKPWRFGNKDDNPLGRGYSDHFPVTVYLRVAE
jgi:endonuclease/exonuclease/phosphatase family metal-dependent hydrolase